MLPSLSVYTLAHTAAVSGDAVALRCGRTAYGGPGDSQYLSGKARHHGGPVILGDEHFEAPEARPIKGHLGHIEAVHLGLCLRPTPAACQRLIERQHLRLQARLCILERVDPHDDVSLGDERGVVEEESKGHPVLPNTRFRRGEHGLECATYLGREPGCGRPRVRLGEAVRTPGLGREQGQRPLPGHTVHQRGDRWHLCRQRCWPPGQANEWPVQQEKERESRRLV